MGGAGDVAAADEGDALRGQLLANGARTRHLVHARGDDGYLLVAAVQQRRGQQRFKVERVPCVDEQGEEEDRGEGGAPLVAMDLRQHCVACVVGSFSPVKWGCRRGEMKARVDLGG